MIRELKKKGLKKIICIRNSVGSEISLINIELCNARHLPIYENLPIPMKYVP